MVRPEAAGLLMFGEGPAGAGAERGPYRPARCPSYYRARSRRFSARRIVTSVTIGLMRLMLCRLAREAPSCRGSSVKADQGGRADGAGPEPVQDGMPAAPAASRAVPHWPSPAVEAAFWDLAAAAVLLDFQPVNSFGNVCGSAGVA